MRYEETQEFSRDFKKLLKSFSSLQEDLEINKRYRIELSHNQKIDSKSIFKINSVGNNEELQFFKVKKFQCKSLKGRGAKSGIRVIYALFPKQNFIIFLQIYFKGKQENEDRERIEKFIRFNQKRS